MKGSQLISVVVAITMVLVVGTAAVAQSDEPNVQVAETGIVDGAATIVEATVTGPGWAVIHADDGGEPGPVIGYAPLVEGVNENVVVDIDTDAATPVLHAVLHVDEGEVGTFEFPGPDGPVMVDDSIVMAQFSAEPVVADVVEVAVPDAMPVTGAATSTILVLVVMSAVLSILVLSILVSRRRPV